VTNMIKMFANARSFNQDLSSWPVKESTDMEKMFIICPISEENKPVKGMYSIMAATKMGAFHKLDRDVLTNVFEMIGVSGKKSRKIAVSAEPYNTMYDRKLQLRKERLGKIQEENSTVKNSTIKKSTSNSATKKNSPTSFEYQGKRCPNGYRRNKVTKRCQKKTKK